MPKYQKARAEAENIWERSNFSGPPLPILEVAENLGLNVQEVEFTEYKDVAGVLDVKNQIIYVEKGDNVFRKRFTIAHEIGHWVLHREQLNENPDLGIYYRRPIGGETDEKEKEANAFAANLLVPAFHLATFMGCSDVELSQIFAVSQQVIGYRKRWANGLIND